MAWSFVKQQANGDANATATAPTISYTVSSSSDLLIVMITNWVNSGGNNIPAVSGLGATWTKVVQNNTSDTNAGIWIGNNPTSGSGTLTLTFSPATYWNSNISEWSGGSTTTEGTATTGLGAASPSITTTTSGDLVVACVDPSNDYTTMSAFTTAGWTGLTGNTDSSNNNSIAAAYNIQGTAGAIVCDPTTVSGGLGGTTTSDWWAIAAFKAGVAAPAYYPFQRQSLAPRRRASTW